MHLLNQTVLSEAILINVTNQIIVNTGNIYKYKLVKNQIIVKNQILLKMQITVK